jgi:hypothetical protein
MYTIASHPYGQAWPENNQGSWQDYGWSAVKYFLCFNCLATTHLDGRTGTADMLRYPTTAINDSWRCFAISQAEDRLYKQMELKDGVQLGKARRWGDGREHAWTLDRVSSNNGNGLRRPCNTQDEISHSHADHPALFTTMTRSPSHY